MAHYYNNFDVSKAKGCLERAYSAIHEASQWPNSHTRQCPILIKVAEVELEAAVKLIENSKVKS